MQKTLKWIGFIIVILAFLVVLTGILFSIFFKPDDFKKMFDNQFYAATGRHLTIQGELKLAYFPWLGVRAKDVDIGNPSGTWSKPFVRLGEVDVRIKVLPLFLGRLNADKIILNKLTVNLITKQDGQQNWVAWLKDKKTNDVKQQVSLKQAKTIQSTSNQNKTTSAKQTENRPKTKNNLQWELVDIPGVTVSNATVNWINEQNKKTITFSNLELTSRNIGYDIAFPISAQSKISSKNPDVNGYMNFRINLKYDKTSQVLTFYSIRFVSDLTGKSLPEQQININIDSQMKFDFRQHVINLKKLDLAGSPFNISQLTGKISYVPVGENKNNLKKMSQKLEFHATLQAKLLKLNQLNLRDVQGKLVANEGIYHLTSLTAQVFQGKLLAKARVDLSGDTPQYTIEESMQNVQAAPLLALTGLQLGKIDKGIDTWALFNRLWKALNASVKGVGTMDAKITAEGNTAQDIRESLAGNVDFMLKDGAIQGVDLEYYFKLGQALLKQETPPKLTQPHVTKFGSFKASFNIDDGVAETENLFLQSPLFRMTGEGTINLKNEKLDLELSVMQMKTKKVDGKKIQVPRDTVIPLKVSGTVNKPNVQPDLGALLRLQTRHRINKYKDKITDQIKKSIENIFN